MIKKTKTIRIPTELANQASETAKKMNRSVNGQVTHWIELGMLADLTTSVQRETDDRITVQMDSALKSGAK